MPSLRLGRGQRVHSQDWLIETIQTATSGPWEFSGSGGTLKRIGDVLVVRHAYQDLVEVAGLLGALLIVAEGWAAGAAVRVVPPGYPLSADEAIRKALTRSIGPIEYNDLELETVMADIGTRIGRRLLKGVIESSSLVTPGGGMGMF